MCKLRRLTVILCGIMRQKTFLSGEQLGICMSNFEETCLVVMKQNLWI